MLCCSAGMSTSLLVKMVDEAHKRGLEAEIKAYGVAEFAEQVGHYRGIAWTTGEVHAKRSTETSR